MLLDQILWGGVLVELTVLFQGVALDRLMHLLEWAGPKVYAYNKRLWKAIMLILSVKGVFLSLTVNIWLWAFFYLYIDVLPDLETALYFSTAAFTTVGFGDVVLDKSWRLMNVFQAANGFILFGWSTAFIFEVTSKIYRGETIRKTERA